MGHVSSHLTVGAARGDVGRPLLCRGDAEAALVHFCDGVAESAQEFKAKCVAMWEPGNGRAHLPDTGPHPNVSIIRVKGCAAPSRTKCRALLGYFEESI